MFFQFCFCYNFCLCLLWSLVWVWCGRIYPPIQLIRKCILKEIKRMPVLLNTTKPYLCTWPCCFNYKKLNFPRPTSGRSYLGILLHLLDNRWGGNYPVNMHLCHLLLKFTDTPVYFCPEEWIENRHFSFFNHRIYANPNLNLTIKHKCYQSRSTVSKLQLPNYNS